MVLALALHFDPVYVAAHHVARFVVTAFSIAIAARWIARDKSGDSRHFATEQYLHRSFPRKRESGWSAT